MMDTQEYEWPAPFDVDTAPPRRRWADVDWVKVAQFLAFLAAFAFYVAVMVLWFLGLISW